MILIIGFVAVKADHALKSCKSKIKIAGVIVTFIDMPVASVVQVEPGQVSVQKLFGKVNDNILARGLNVINPFTQIVMSEMRTENYTTSGTYDEGTIRGDDAIRVLSADGLEVVVDFAVLY